MLTMSVLTNSLEDLSKFSLHLPKWLISPVDKDSMSALCCAVLIMHVHVCVHVCVCTCLLAISFP